MRHDTGEVLYAKNSGEPQSIASVTKLMTAIVVMDQGLALNEQIRISEEDVDTLKNSRSRVPVGTTLSREELLLLALMSSENRAASALARTSVPGGLPRFIEAMNRKAQVLGMHNTRFRDPTGLNPGNISTASDLAKMAQAAYQHPLIRRMTTTPESEVYFPNRHLPMEYRNTNSLVRNQLMAVGLSKTGYIREAGRCLVMQANLADDPYLMVFLGSASHAGPAQDALKLERWLTYRRQQGG
jgi:D-alanyl-D-alanine endopeptidase (penicillin-binding protein 7)